MITDIVNQIQNVIEERIVPYVESHGGKIQYLGFENGIVRVSLSGACKGCSAQSITVHSGIGRMLRKQFREVERVELIES